MKLLKFRIPHSFEVPAPSSDEKTALSVITSSAADSYRVTVLIRSTCRSDPLQLKASPLPAGAEIAVLIHPWRIELWADGKLMDEEWPAGALLTDHILALGVMDSANHAFVDLLLLLPDKVEIDVVFTQHIDALRALCRLPDTFAARGGVGPWSPR